MSDRFLRIRFAWSVLRRRLFGWASAPSHVTPPPRPESIAHPTSIPDWLSRALPSDTPDAREAAARCQSLFSELTVSRLPRLDDSLRERSTWGGGWWSIEPRDLAMLDAHEEQATTLRLLAIGHPNGFVREAAIRDAVEREAPEALPFLLLRRNDWVGEVRALACRATEEMLTPRFASDFARALPLVERLRDCGRMDHADFVSRVEALLRAPDNAEALAEGTRSPDRATRRSCYRLGLEPGCPMREALIGRGLEDHDPIVRLQAARSATDGSVPTPSSWLDRMERDAYAPVRQTGLVARVEQEPAAANTVYERHLLDRSASIRQLSQRALERSGRSPAPRYRDALVSVGARSLEIALVGLGEVGGPEDAPRAATRLEHPAPRVRAAALRALARLSNDDLSALLAERLQDPSPRVSREARNAILGARVRVEPETLQQRFETSPHRHGKLNALACARLLGRWPRLLFGLRAAEDPDAVVSERAVAFVTRWNQAANRAALAASPEELEAADAALAASTAIRGLPLEAELELLLRTQRSRAPRE